jgi:hypothetical protein
MESKVEMRITTGTAKTLVEPHTAGRKMIYGLELHWHLQT